MKIFHTITTAIPFIIFSFLLSGCTNKTTQTDIPDDPDVTTIEFDNMGATAYVVLSIAGDGASANLNEENAAINLRVGDRFRFNNTAGASNHPLDLRNSERTKLLGQSNSDGQFDSDSDVDVETDGNIISFTLTESLAAELNGYVCSFHPGMNGSISTIE